MNALELDQEEARVLLEIKRRRMARSSLVEYARFIEIPGVPIEPASAGDFGCTCDAGITDPDEAAIARSKGSCPGCKAWGDLKRPITYKPVESSIVLHHRIILEAIQRTMETPRGRLMILAPPGSAKSTMADVIAPSWAMGKWPGYQIIISTYATALARKQARKTLQVVRSRRWRNLWKERPELRRDVQAAHEWGLSNGSMMLAAGILAGITGNRAHGFIADDLIAGREEAESPTIRAKIMDAYRDDLESRLLPNGWGILINTRWHMEDPSGSILPDDYHGQSGFVRCKDGLLWYVLNIPAKCENADDPLGRAIGEYLWPEWFPKEHWQAFENNPLGRRRWGSLFQGRPTNDAGDDFKRADAMKYRAGRQPEKLTIYAASDWAVKEQEPEDQQQGRIDKSEQGIVGMDDVGNLYFLDWQTDQGGGTEVTVPLQVDHIAKWKPELLWIEGGTIDKAVRPALRREMRERRRFATIVDLPSIADKRAKCQSFAARYGARTCYFPVDEHGEFLPWAADLIDQLCGFPGHRYDDKYDVCGLIGRGIDKMRDAPPPPEKKKPGPTPFTEQWLTAKDPDDEQEPRYR